MSAAVKRNVRNLQSDMLYRIFSSNITGRRYVPGREVADEEQEKRREYADFEVIDDYIEEA